MLKRMALGFSLLLLISIFVTGEKEKKSHDANAYAQGRDCAALAAVNGPKGQRDCEDAQRYKPSWESAVAFRIFGWPEGITSWALFATLAVIAWQSNETRRAAIATETASRTSLRQINLTKEKERARVRIRQKELKVTTGDPAWWFLMATIQVQNLGSNRAFLTRAKGYLMVVDDSNVNLPDPSDEIGELAIPFGFLDPTSEEQPLIVALHRFPDETRALTGYSVKIFDGTFVPHIRGFVEYETLGIKFVRRFSFRWQSTKGSFALLWSGGKEPEDGVGKIEAGYWAEDAEYGNEEYELDTPN